MPAGAGMGMEEDMDGEREEGESRPLDQAAVGAMRVFMKVAMGAQAERAGDGSKEKMCGRGVECEGRGIQGAG